MQYFCFWVEGDKLGVNLFIDGKRSTQFSFWNMKRLQGRLHGVDLKTNYKALFSHLCFLPWFLLKRRNFENEPLLAEVFCVKLCSWFIWDIIWKSNKSFGLLWTFFNFIWGIYKIMSKLQSFLIYHFVFKGTHPIHARATPLLPEPRWPRIADRHLW